MTFRNITPDNIDTVWDKYSFYELPLTPEQTTDVRHMNRLMCESRMVENVVVNTVRGIVESNEPHVRIAAAVAVALRIGWYAREEAEHGTFPVPVEAEPAAIPPITLGISEADTEEIEEILRQIRQERDPGEGDPGDEQQPT